MSKLYKNHRDQKSGKRFTSSQQPKKTTKRPQQGPLSEMVTLPGRLFSLVECGAGLGRKFPVLLGQGHSQEPLVATPNIPVHQLHPKPLLPANSACSIKIVHMRPSGSCSKSLSMHSDFLKSHIHSPHALASLRWIHVSFV